jgi:serine/threonine protein kinase
LLCAKHVAGNAITDTKLVDGLCKVNAEQESFPIHGLCEKIALLCGDDCVKEEVLVGAINQILARIEEQGNFDAASATDSKGRTLLQIAEGYGGNSLLFDAIQHKILFHGAYKITAPLVAHRSASSLVSFAESYDFVQGSVHATVTSVALKFMSDVQVFQREVDMRRELDGKFVVLELQSHNSRKDSEDAFLFATAIDKFKDGAYSGYPYCLVLPRAVRSLAEAISHDHIAGAADRILDVSGIVQNTVCALAHLHEKGLAHTDVQPSCIVQVGHTWKLIDLGAATALGQPVNRLPKYRTASCYAPPELLVCTKDGVTEVREAGGDDKLYYELAARESFDIWSVGALLYLLVTGRTLFYHELDGSLDGDELPKLANWDQLSLGKALRHVNEEGHMLLAKDLLGNLLQSDPGGRAGSMSEVLEHAFFADGGGGSGTALTAIVERVEKVLEECAVAQQTMADQEARKRELLAFANERSWTIAKLQELERVATATEPSVPANADLQQQLQQRLVRSLLHYYITTFVCFVANKSANSQDICEEENRDLRQEVQALKSSASSASSAATDQGLLELSDDDADEVTPFTFRTFRGLSAILSNSSFL